MALSTTPGVFSAGRPGPRGDQATPPPDRGNNYVTSPGRPGPSIQLTAHIKRPTGSEAAPVAKPTRDRHRGRGPGPDAGMSWLPTATRLPSVWTSASPASSTCARDPGPSGSLPVRRGHGHHHLWHHGVTAPAGEFGRQTQRRLSGRGHQWASGNSPMVDGESPPAAWQAREGQLKPSPTAGTQRAQHRRVDLCR